MTRQEVPKQAMLLAAGEGTRLRPLTEKMPKCMVPIDGKPVLEHNILWLRSFGVEEFVINLYYMPDAVMDYFGDGSGWNVKIDYSLETRLLGTAGGLKNAESFFDGPFLLWYGDNLSSINLRRFAHFHAERNGTATMAVFYREDPTSSGIIGLDDASRVTRFLEKPARDQVFSHWVNAGIFLLEQDVFEHIPAGVFSDFGHEILPAMLSDDVAMFAYKMDEAEGLWWIDTPEDLQRIQGVFQRRLNTP